MIAVDTNVLLRFLFKPVDTKNPTWQVDVGEALINRAAKVYISDVVIEEMEWVLDSVFACNRQDIYSVIHALSSNAKFQFDDWSALNNALRDYIEYNAVELSDCLIALRAQSTGATSLFTFENEKKLGALPVVTRLEKPD